MWNKDIYSFGDVSQGLHLQRFNEEPKDEEHIERYKLCIIDELKECVNRLNNEIEALEQTNAIDIISQI